MPNPTKQTAEEINREIHTRVMGIVWDESRCRVCGWPVVPSGKAGCWAENCSMRPMPERRADTIPNYCGSIGDAWSVVEKMRTDGFFVCVRGNPDSLRFLIEGSRSEYDAPSKDKPIGPTGAWVCEISHPDRITSAWRIDKDPCMAICLAALQALPDKGGKETA